MKARKKYKCSILICTFLSYYYSIFEDTLNLKTVAVRDRIDDGDGRYHYEVNKNETMLYIKETLNLRKMTIWFF